MRKFGLLGKKLFFDTLNFEALNIFLLLAARRFKLKSKINKKDIFFILI